MQAKVSKVQKKKNDWNDMHDILWQDERMYTIYNNYSPLTSQFDTKLQEKHFKKHLYLYTQMNT